MGPKVTGGLDVLAGCTASSRGTTYENNIYFDHCMDFLARMIMKYGDRIEFPDQEEPEQSKGIKETTAKLQSKSANGAKQAQTGQQQKKPKKKRNRGLDR